MSQIEIPFNKPALVGNELAYMNEAVARGHISGDGEFTRRCQDLLQRELGVANVLLTTSCTHALELAALLLDVQPGDEVLVPSFTFTSTINAFVLRGAAPVFIDIRPDTLNLDESKIECAITERTRAIVPVHYAGVGCAMDVIGDMADHYRLAIVEDNAHGLFARYQGKFLGTFGQLATLSFHETKNFTCGEGGALLINDTTLLERAEIIREKGTNRRRFLKGLVDKYTWVDHGSSYLPSDLLAAYLLAQLEERDSVLAQRRAVWDRYYASLSPWAERNGVQLPFVPADAEQGYHMFYLVLPAREDRDDLIRWLREAGILAVFHYVPLHMSEMGQRFGAARGDCPVTERISDGLVRLPFFNELSVDEQTRVVERVSAFVCRKQPILA